MDSIEICEAGDDEGFPAALTGPKRQHFLPRFYLSGFIGTDGCLAVFDRERDRLRRQQPHDTAVQGHIYTYTDEQGRRRYDLESSLGQLEGLSSQVLSKLLSRQEITNEERSMFAHFIAILSARTPDFIESIKHMHGEMMRRVSRVIFSDVDRIFERLRKDPLNKDKDDVALWTEAEEVQAFAMGDDFEIETDHQWAVGTALSVGDELAPIIHGRNWTICVAPEGCRFLTTDAPVILASGARNQGRQVSGVGFGSADALVFLPLDSGHLLALHGDEVGIGYAKVDAGWVRRINLALAARCRRFLIARDDALLRSVARASGIVNSKWRPKFDVR